MEKRSGQGPGENEGREGSSGDTSAGRTSRRRGSSSIDRETRLRILQQAVFDYQEAGGTVRLVQVPEIGLAVALHGVRMAGGRMVEMGRDAGGARGGAEDPSRVLRDAEKDGGETG